MSNPLKLPWTVERGKPATDSAFVGHTSEIHDCEGNLVADFVRDDVAEVVAISPELLAMLGRFRRVVTADPDGGKFRIMIGRDELARLVDITSKLERIRG